MRKTLCFLVAGMLSTAAVFAQDKIASAKPGQTYGQPTNASNAIKMTDLQAKLKTDTVYNGKVEGTVVEVCKKKGCFMKLTRPNGDPVMVRFKDYGFFMPQDIVGKTVVVNGVAQVKETSVERLQHYAEDAGKSKEEIAKITQPKTDITFMADGVYVVK
ncbi:DUF4920 domain-containing protein [Chitinophaga horti]|uniref:DUF4920 domain-containing protein n=1 Tax=Chitinophaga horti TaxID=2920382 RepID=A0ABY6J0X7_9BACT|nr:DUF4920 domain-containing protein [Chitinophaga horti]UYQ92021.1 DUF4920 domain-containing protein [Chitinophaga horti]